MKEARRFQHITWRTQGSQKGWIVQWKGQTLGGFHTTQTAAAQVLKTAMGLASIAHLPRAKGLVVGKKGQRQTVRHKGVYWHKGKRAYVTRAGGLFSSVMSAAQAVQAPRKCLKPSEVLRRMHRMREVYDKGELPADVEDLFARATTLRAMCKLEPALEPLIVQLKYGPWRDAVMKWVHRILRPASPPSSVPDRAQSLLQVLSCAAETVAKVRVSKHWVQNAGRGVCRHSGGHVVLKHLGVLSPSTRTGLNFHAEGNDSDDESDVQWSLPGTVAAKKAALQKIEYFIVGWDTVAPHLATPPLKCDDWCSRVKSSLQSLRGLRFKVPRLPRPASTADDKYTTLWTLRACMLLRMRQARVTELPVGDVSLRRFCTMNPDESHHVKRIYHANKAHIKSTRDLVRLCGAERPELLSMELCLASDRGLDNVDIHNIDVNQWRCVKSKLKAKIGMNPHIAVIAKHIVKKGGL